MQTAEENLAYCSVRAPIAGIVSAVAVVVGEAAPSPAASIVTQGKLAEVTLNEVDAAKVELGDKATFTFDALAEPFACGQVSEIDPVGTVSQGVVNYNVQVAFQEARGTSPGEARHERDGGYRDASGSERDRGAERGRDDARNARATCLSRQRPLRVKRITASANGGVTLSRRQRRVPVTVGIANDTMTEITSGVNVGDQISRKRLQITAAASAASTGGTSALRASAAGSSAAEARAALAAVQPAEEASVSRPAEEEALLPEDEQHH